MSKSNTATKSSTMIFNYELEISRLIDAPRSVVFDAWTDPEKMKQWWGPTDFTAPYIYNDVRVGGKYLFDMRGPDGRDFWSTGVYREVTRPERIVATDSFADQDGNVIPASSYGLGADYPLYLMLTVTFEEVAANRTRLTISHTGVPLDSNDDERQGWNQSLDKFEALIRSQENP